MLRIIDHIEKFQKIEPIYRKTSYYTEGHDGRTDSPESTSEKNITKRMFRQGWHEGIHGVGIILDYETPLNNKNVNSAGKIDLLALAEDKKTLRILELKRPDSVESMLRCALEAYTYLKWVDRKKLICDFNRDGNVNIPEDSQIVACPFVFRYKSNGKDGTQYKEMQEYRPKLKKLMELLEIKPLVIEEIDGRYSARKL